MVEASHDDGNRFQSGFQYKLIVAIILNRLCKLGKKRQNEQNSIMQKLTRILLLKCQYSRLERN